MKNQLVYELALSDEFVRLDLKKGKKANSLRIGDIEFVQFDFAITNWQYWMNLHDGLKLKTTSLRIGVIRCICMIWFKKRKNNCFSNWRYQINMYNLILKKEKWRFWWYRICMIWFKKKNQLLYKRSISNTFVQSVLERENITILWICTTLFKNRKQLLHGLAILN